MKRFLSVSVIFILAVIVCLFSSSQVNAAGNLLLNPSFEETDHIAYWMNEGTATFSWVADWHPQEGKWSFGVGNDLEHAQDGAWGRCLQVICDPKNPDNLYQVTAGETFTYKMWIKGEENYKGKASLKLEFFDYDRRLGFTEEPLAVFQSKAHTGKFAWLQDTVRGVAPKGTVSVAVSFVSEEMSIGPGTSFVWFDNASVTVTPAM